MSNIINTYLRVYIASRRLYMSPLNPFAPWDLCGKITPGSTSLATLSFPPDYLSVATGWHMAYNTAPNSQLTVAQSFFEGVNKDFSLVTWGQE
jgi:hypothetical protein